jgi:two-component system sensor histidine kinase MprB
VQVGSDATISVTVADGSVVVADRGPGIPEQDLDRIFDRFHRADAARALPGSGLGLSIVAEVARRHGGDVVARNRVDGGAEVGFRLGAG